MSSMRGSGPPKVRPRLYFSVTACPFLRICSTNVSAAVFAKRSLRMNLAASVAEIGYEKLLLGDVCGYAELKPMYLRLSQAEREKAEREKLNRESNINEK